MSDRWEIANGPYRATVMRAGGGLGDLEYDRTPLVVAPAIDQPVSRGRGQILVPWPNRIRDGRYSFGGSEQQLAINEVAKNNASHGLVRWLEWTCLDHDDSEIEVAARLMPQSGYPWSLDVRVRYSLSSDGLAITLEATNLSDSPAPFAAGFHPYFDLGVPADDVELTVLAAKVISTDKRSLPLGPDAVRIVDDEIDFQSPRLIGPTILDHGFTNVERDDDGWSKVTAIGAHTITVAFDSAWPWVWVFTGDTLGADARMSVAIEPHSAPVDAFNSGIDLVSLVPGETWRGAVSISRR